MDPLHSALPMGKALSYKVRKWNSQKSNQIQKKRFFTLCLVLNNFSYFSSFMVKVDKEIDVFFYHTGQNHLGRLPQMSQALKINVISRNLIISYHFMMPSGDRVNSQPMFMKHHKTSLQLTMKLSTFVSDL